PLHPLAAIPDVAEADDVDRLLLALHLQEDAEVLLGAAARAEDGDVELLVGPLDGADGRMGEGTGCHRGAGRDTRRLQETPTAHHRLVSHRSDSRWLVGRLVGLIPHPTGSMEECKPGAAPRTGTRSATAAGPSSQADISEHVTAANRLRSS